MDSMPSNSSENAPDAETSAPRPVRQERLNAMRRMVPQLTIYAVAALVAYQTSPLHDISTNGFGGKPRHGR